MNIVTYFMMYVVLFLTSVLEIVNALNRQEHFIVTKRTSNYSYPLALANNRTNVPSAVFCGVLCLLDNGISYSYSHETKICLTYTKIICTTDGGMLSPGLFMYNIKAEDPTSCADVQCSGVYTFEIQHCSPALTLSCDMDESGSLWTVIQRRIDGAVDFARPWKDYMKGFGDAERELWLGNDNIHCLTTNGYQELRVEIETTDGSLYYAQYSSFVLGDAASKYKLSVSGYNGTAGDSLTYHNGAPFSTIDQDNDNNVKIHCGEAGAWWHKKASRVCCDSVLNGDYGLYILWYGISKKSHKKTKMMIRKRL